MEDCEYHIHDTFLGTSGWKADLWGSLMGTETLVDLVNQIWNVASTAVSTIKDAASTALNVVKSGMQWISDNVIIPIIDESVAGFVKMVHVLGYIL